jgi:L-2-hydroxyglutarate oxidase LhgO
VTYEFCADYGVPHRRTGKLVVASAPAESEELSTLVKNGETNGVEHVQIIAPREKLELLSGKTAPTVC